MDTEVVLRLIAGVLLILANAFFVTTEFALTRIRQLPAEEFQGSRNLRRAWEMTERLEIYLTGCQLGITASSILLGVIAEPAITALLEPLFGAIDWSAATRHTVSVVVAIAIMNLVHKIWGEQAPTYLGVERPKQVAETFAPGLYWWTKIMYPVIIAGDGLAKSTLRLFGVEITRSWTEDEGGDGEMDATDAPIEGRFAARQEMLKLLGRVEGLAPDRRDEVVAALDIGDRPIAEIMVERDDIVALRDDDVGVLAQLVRENPHTRFPLVGDELEDFRGIVYVPAVLARIDELRDGTVGLSDVAVDPMKLEAQTSIADAIDRFQAARQELALVTTGERVVGLLTSTDAFEAIAGELEDPFDEASATGAGER